MENYIETMLPPCSALTHSARVAARELRRIIHSSDLWPALSIFLAQQLFQVAGVVLAGAEDVLFEESHVEGDGGLDTLQAVLAQGAAGAVYSLLAGEGPDDELTDHRVIERWDLVTLVDGRVHPDAGAAGDVEEGDLTRRGHEVLLGVLGVDPKLHRVTDERHILLLDA